MKDKIRIAVAITLCAAGLGCMELQAQETMTLQQCRDLAIANNKSLKAAEQKVEMAEYDRKIAMANYFPEVSANAGWMYNSRNLNLLSEKTSDFLLNMGHNVSILEGSEISRVLSDIGREINNAFTLDIENVFAGAISLQQPVFAGGKIVAANKMAKMAAELAESQYDTEYRTVISDVDQAYWQIVSIAGKKKLAEDYCSLLHQLLHDAGTMEEEGVATAADVLTIKVKSNEADLMLTKATNGLILSKMLLCKLCGMDLYSEITLADENLDRIPVPSMAVQRTEQEIFDARPEIRSLNLACGIYDKKISMAKADMMPQVGLTANYFLTNPNLYHGFRNDFGGMFNVGVIVKIPVFHGCEAMYKVRKARSEAAMTREKLEEAKEMVTLQVNQLRQQNDEAWENLTTSESNLECAEENLRVATIAFNEGIVPANTVLEAQTAWVKAHSEYIDASVELQLSSSRLKNAQGEM